MNGALFLGVVAIYLLICVAWGLLRGLAKARFRAVTILFSAVAAVVTAVICKATYFNDAFVANTVIPLLESNEMAEVVDFLQMSPAMTSSLVGLAGALVAPLLCLVFFIAYSIITWIIFFIFTLIFRRGMKEHNQRSHMSLLRAAAVSLAQGLVVILIVMIPVSCYLNIASVAGSQAVEAGLVEGDDAQTVKGLADSCADINESAGAFIFRKLLGGDALVTMLTTFEVNEETTTLTDEIDAVASLVCNGSKLGQTELADYGENEAQIFGALGDSFDDSVVLPVILGELLYNATDAWEKGDTFMGMEKPTAGEGEQGELVAPFLDELFDILHDDARDVDALQADFRTVAQMAASLAKNGIFASMDNSEELMLSLGKEGVVDSLVTTLGSNNSMKRLIPQITNLGIRAIGQTLGIPADVASVYNDLLEDVAESLNRVAALQGTEQLDALTIDLVAAFDTAGVPVDREVVDFYAAAMATDLLASGNEVTTNDVQAFFALYATHADPSSLDARGEATSTPLSGTASIYDGTVYEGMSEEELASTGAAALVGLFTNLSQLEQDEEFSANASALISEAFGELLDDDVALIEHLAAKPVTKPVSTETLKSAAGMDSKDNLNTKKVTVKDLLVDVSAATEMINKDTLGAESQALSAIFNAAGGFMSMTDGEELDLATVAGSVGNVLDSLKVTASFGSEKTANLFTAVFQSEQVRSTANIDMMTATQMAEKATEGDAKYTETLTAVSQSINTITTLGKGEDLSEEELVKLIENINPQTAGMMEIYATPERLVEHGVPEENADTSSALLVSTFSYMAREDLEDYDAEAKALNQVLSLAMLVKNSDGSKPLFSTEGNEDGCLPTERETITVLMSSHAITYAVKDVLTDGEQVTKMDPFGVKAEIGEDESDEVASFRQTIVDYKTENPDTDTLALEAMAALFGIEVDL